jgi:hypothetical protein
MLCRSWSLFGSAAIRLENKGLERANHGNSNALIEERYLTDSGQQVTLHTVNQPGSIYDDVASDSFG